MKKLYQTIIRFFTTQTIPSQVIYSPATFSFIEEIEKQKDKEEKRIKQLIRLEVRKQLNKKYSLSDKNDWGGKV